jgi:hypothetical protein
MATAGEDRVQLGLVMSFGRKWQHHGVTFIVTLMAKGLDFLHQLVPKRRRLTKEKGRRASVD